MLYLSREPGTWSRDLTALADFDLFCESTDFHLERVGFKISKFERVMLYFMAFNAMVKWLAPKTNQQKVTALVKNLGPHDLDGWVLKPRFCDGLEVFMGTADDDRMPLSLEFLHIWHSPLDRTNLLDHLFITSDNKALKEFSRRSEYAVPDGISDHGDRKITLGMWKMFGFSSTLGAHPPAEIRDILYTYESLIDELKSDFMHKMKWSSTFLRFSKTDYLKNGVWTVAGTTADTDSDANINVIIHLCNRLRDGEVLLPESPLLGVRINKQTVPLDFKFLSFYDKHLSAALGLDQIFNIKGQSRRKGAASTIVIDRYIKKSHARLTELDVIACVSALKNRRLGQLPAPANI